ncbi:hypothetical protein KMZ30_19100 [Phycicoccus sp. KQZ13P-1]|uniref:hypothetical protein n=1 Tax=Phycicoccus mangrovi TaxID=2840470 RepID=UPI001BFFDB7F|nr:hypothetical protein [Phycicoccus mangrovi]MBT9257686.1 hypothetical protein [Phycicoccus mangrovi]
MDIVLEPPTGAAGIDIGASRLEAESQLAAHGEPKTFRRGDEGNPSLAVHTTSGCSVFVYFDDADLVEAVELSRPDRGDTVTFEDIDVFATRAEEVIGQLTRRTVVQVEENGCSVTATELLLALWRPTVPESDQDEEGRHFESVLVARPGYYD